MSTNRQTKAQLREELGACQEAYANWQAEAEMAKVYYEALQTHLRAHGCDHDFADVADDPEMDAERVQNLGRIGGMRPLSPLLLDRLQQTAAGEGVHPADLAEHLITVGFLKVLEDHAREVAREANQWSEGANLPFKIKFSS